MRFLDSLLSTVAFFGATSLAIGQLTISDGTPWASQGSLILFTIRGDVTINSATADLKDCALELSGTSQALNANTPVTLQSLNMNGVDGLTATLTGEWTIAQDIQFPNGIIAPTADARLIFTGSVQPEGNASSYVNGKFYSKGKGLLFFPIGTPGNYTPAILHNIYDASSPIALAAIAGSAPFQVSGEITDIIRSHYYQLTASPGATNGSVISLSATDLDNLTGQQGLVVLQSDGVSGVAVSLGGQDGRADFISSTRPASAQFLTIGKSEKIELVIYDLISPVTQDHINDKLKISNIGLTIQNHVTLFDRWGIVVKEWKDLHNYDDLESPNTDNFDFTKLNPGNYLCVVEYKFNAESSFRKVAQMITVLKAK